MCNSKLCSLHLLRNTTTVDVRESCVDHCNDQMKKEVVVRDAQVFQKFMSNIKILFARNVAWHRFRPEDLSTRAWGLITEEMRNAYGEAWSWWRILLKCIFIGTVEDCERDCAAWRRGTVGVVLSTSSKEQAGYEQGREIRNISVNAGASQSCFWHVLNTCLFRIWGSHSCDHEDVSPGMWHRVVW
jgi:hypothetical protein